MAQAARARVWREGRVLVPASIVLARPRVNPGKRAVEAFDLVDQDQRLAIGTTPTLCCDDEIGLVRIGFEYPRPLQHRPDQPIAPRDADQDARWRFALSKGWFVVEPALEPTQALGSSRRPIILFEFVVGLPSASREPVDRTYSSGCSLAKWATTTPA